MDSKTIADQLKSFIGKEVGRYTSWNQVNQPMIRQWCQALGDNNPLYERGFAPPPMMMSWALRDIHGRLAPGSSRVSPFAPLELLSRAGFTKVVDSQDAFRDALVSLIDRKFLPPVAR